MNNDTTTTQMTVSAEEQAILGRFAARACEAANVPTDNGSESNSALMFLIMI